MARAGLAETLDDNNAVVRANGKMMVSEAGSGRAAEQTNAKGQVCDGGLQTVQLG
jgi:hypothetical protein